MSPRTGRPVIGKRKDVDIKVRIDEDTNKKLQSYCEKERVSRAEAIRRGIDMVLSDLNK